MKYTLSMLRKKLIQSHFDVSSITGPDEAFKKLRFSMPLKEPEEETLYLYEQSVSTIVLLTAASGLSIPGRNYTEVCSAVVEICQFYDSWEKDLHEMIWEQKSLQDLIDRSEEIFRNPIFLSNWQGNVLGYSKAYKEAQIRPFWHTVTHDNRVPLDTLATLMDSEYRHLLKDENQVHLLSFPGISYRSLFGLIHEAGEIVLQFQIIEYANPLDDADLALAGNLLNILRFFYRNTQQTGRETALDVFRQLIHGASVKQEELGWTLDYLGWTKKDTDYALALITNRDGTSCDRTMFPQMERRVPGCRILEADANMIMLFPLEILQKLEAEFLHVLDVFHLYAGISMPFRDWNTLSGSYAQAKLVIRYCTADASCSHSLSFIWNVFLNALKDENLKQSLIHPAVAALKAYDENNQTDLTHTLYQYLACERSNVDAAAALYIHRNTLKYRLDKIYDLLHLDLDDLDTRLHLLISFRLQNAGDWEPNLTNRSSGQLGAV